MDKVTARSTTPRPKILGTAQDDSSTSSSAIPHLAETLGTTMVSKHRATLCSITPDGSGPRTSPSASNRSAPHTTAQQRLDTAQDDTEQIAPHHPGRRDSTQRSPPLDTVQDDTEQIAPHHPGRRDSTQCSPPLDTVQDHIEQIAPHHPGRRDVA
ncbi:hypothetical protein L226DRAFT_574949 [Lentinus tigrinus ALCF2SS1-7]|uniref:uncharacterized protein n=1 Tax=Lentinus tigrinus ALCF2SS1-7 TaxID=1328758 RepID=UPI0011660005|nr:hypothetical protein L226DRAFT_574949 [Lentinus tigrinus ALCF2SS1-7]